MYALLARIRRDPDGHGGKCGSRETRPRDFPSGWTRRIEARREAAGRRAGENSGTEYLRRGRCACDPIAAKTESRLTGIPFLKVTWFDPGSSGRRCYRGLFRIFLIEPLDATSRVDKLLLPGEKRMALGTDFNFHTAARGAGLEYAPANAGDE